MRANLCESFERIVRRAAVIDERIAHDERFRRQPTESKIEEEFQWWMSKFLAVEGHTQVPVSTSRGNFRLDFLFDGHVAIELDGKKFHDFNRDAIRDRAILCDTKITEIIRIPGAVWWWREEDTMDVLMRWHARFFDEPCFDFPSDGFRLSIEMSDVGATWSRYTEDAETVHVALGGDDGIDYGASYESYFNPWRENHSLRRQDCFVARRTKQNIDLWCPRGDRGSAIREERHETR